MKTQQSTNIKQNKNERKQKYLYTDLRLNLSKKINLQDEILSKKLIGSNKHDLFFKSKKSFPQNPFQSKNFINYQINHTQRKIKQRQTSKDTIYKSLSSPKYSKKNTITKSLQNNKIYNIHIKSENEKQDLFLSPRKKINLKQITQIQRQKIIDFRIQGKKYNHHLNHNKNESKKIYHFQDFKLNLYSDLIKQTRFITQGINTSNISKNKKSYQQILEKFKIQSYKSINKNDASKKIIEDHRKTMLKSAHSSKKKNIKTETEVLKSSSGDVISIIQENQNEDHRIAHYIYSKYYSKQDEQQLKKQINLKKQKIQIKKNIDKQLKQLARRVASEQIENRTQRKIIKLASSKSSKRNKAQLITEPANNDVKAWENDNIS